MPAGKPIAECLQGLGLLAQGPKPNKSQWTALVKSIYGPITGLIASIEEEGRAGGHAKSLNERIKDRTGEWVDKSSNLWTLKNRGSLFPHAPLGEVNVSTHPKSLIVREQTIAHLITSMTSWLEQLVRNKLDRATK